jgi:sporulation protein YlmC with PRC-barrel domain
VLIFTLMQRNINRLLDYAIRATDGEIGKVTAFYFDDDNWKIRYLIVRTGTWLFGRKVLISPAALKKGPWESGIFSLDLTKEKIRSSPDIDTDKPVSRQQEIELHKHYPWQNYWGGGQYAYGVFGTAAFNPGLDEELAKEADKHSPDDLHLRSTHRVTGYHLHATDGDIGHVKDFIMDDETWQVMYLVVAIHNWLGGKKVLIPVRLIEKVEWDSSKVFIDASVAFVENSPLFDAAEYIHPEDDNTLHENSNIHIK